MDNYGNEKIFSYLLFHSHLITPYIFVKVIDVVEPVLRFLCASVWYHFFHLFGFLSFRNNNYNWVRNLFLLISFFLFSPSIFCISISISLLWKKNKSSSLSSQKTFKLLFFATRNPTQICLGHFHETERYIKQS